MEKKQERFLYITDGVVMYAYDTETQKTLEFVDGVWEESDIDFEQFYKEHKADCLKVKESEALIMTEMDPREVVDERGLDLE